MSKLFTKTNLSSWILVGAIAGFFALPLLGNGGLPERFTPLAAVEDEIDWSLTHVTETEEPDVDWTLANNADKEDETDWTLASNDRTEEDEVDWTLASNDRTEEDEVDWTLA